MSERGAEGILRRRAEAAEIEAARAAEIEAARRAAETPREPRATVPRGVPTETYWSHITIALIVLFVLYVTVMGDLPAWLDVLVWKPGQAPVFKGAGQAPGGIGGDQGTAKESVVPHSGPNAGPGAQEGVQKLFPWLGASPFGGGKT